MFIFIDNFAVLCYYNFLKDAKKCAFYLYSINIIIYIKFDLKLKYLGIITGGFKNGLLLFRTISYFQ